MSAGIHGCSSWEDIQRRLGSLPEKHKGDLFEELVQAYLLLEPEYASKLKHVWLQREIPSSVSKKLKLPATDQGIDLVAETNDGEFWAIQCKYRQQTDHSLTWRDVSSFTGLAFGVCRGISFGIICSTTERITHVLKEQERIGFCALDVWQGLDAEFFGRLRANLARKPEVLKPWKPRPHQKEAVKAAHQHFVVEKAERGKLIMPCGTGKSLAAYWIAQKLGARRILIAVPSLALIRQTLKVWLRESMANGLAVEWVCVCSDESAGRMDRDDVVVLRQDLGVPCLTNPGDIARWLGQTHRGLTVVFTTYQSGEAIAQAARRAKTRFDLGIMDEAHKTVGSRDKLFSHLLHDRNLPIRRRIFMTATERRYQGEGDHILSMDDPAIYGETFHLLTFKRALEYRPPILSDYKIVTILVSRDEVAEMIRRNVFVQPDKGPWNREIEAEMLAALVALRKAMRKHPIRHAVSFHSSIRRAEVFQSHNDAFTQAFPKDGTLATFHVSGQTPTGTRARIVKEFADTERGLITNARCLTEGVDVPDIDCVLFADPRRSAVDIVQAVGRALRPTPGKKFGYVIVPILHDADAKPEEIFESESFKEILSTLRALAANDDRIIEYFRAVSQGRRGTGGGSVEFDLDERLAQRIDLAEFVRDIDLKCWDRLARLSWRPFGDARAFAQSLGLKNSDQWKAFCAGQLPELEQCPHDIPSNPGTVYAQQGWKGMGDWLGTGNIANFLKKFRPFWQARKFVQQLGLKNQVEWAAWCAGRMPQLGSRPPDIPVFPHRTYKNDGWESLGDWLGTGTVAPFLRKYRPFEAAKAFVHSLNLKTGTEWKAFCQGRMPHLGSLPEDIPATPEKTYKKTGWLSVGDWLGTGSIASYQRKYRPFVEAKAFAHCLNLNTGTEWKAFCQGRMPHLGSLPEDIPAKPDNTYARQGWKGMGDWLGTGSIAWYQRKYRPFVEAKAFAHSLNLKTGTEWKAFCQGRMPHLGSLPDDIPKNPRGTYANEGWTTLGDWLGTGRIATHQRVYLPFAEARRFVRALQLKNDHEWRAYCKGQLTHLGSLPPNIPTNPNKRYANEGWTGLGDWLGTGNLAPGQRMFRPFDKTRAFAHSLKLGSQKEWNLYRKGRMTRLGLRPEDIPRRPDSCYAGEGWMSWGDWLGTGAVADRLKKFRPFTEARAFAGKLKLKSASEWAEFCKGKMPHLGKLPSDIPVAVDNAYAGKGWKGMGDWLGTGRRRKPKRRSPAKVEDKRACRNAPPTA